MVVAHPLGSVGRCGAGAAGAELVLLLVKEKKENGDFQDFLSWAERAGTGRAETGGQSCL